MAIARSVDTIENRYSFAPQATFSPLPEYIAPGQQFIEMYGEWMDRELTLALPYGSKTIIPKEAGLERRYEFITSTFEEDADKRDIRGAYGEIMAGFLLNRMIEQATDGEFTVVPTPVQFDVCGRRVIRNLRQPGSEDREKTADVILGRVMQINGRRVIEPIMLFDIKSNPREHKRDRKIGLGVNLAVTPLSVGIFYLGEMQFEDHERRIHSAAEYIENFIHPAVLENNLPWDTLWPQNAAHSSRYKLFMDMCEEALTSCAYTRERIDQKNWAEPTRSILLAQIRQAETMFQQVRRFYEGSNLDRRISQIAV